MQVWLASYKGFSSNPLNSLAAYLIRKFSRGLYSHNEIVISAIGEDPFTSPVNCISSSARDHGVRLKTMILSPEKWDLTPLSIDSEIAWSWYRENDGKGYDYLGVARFVLPFFTRPHKTKWFCSEACASILGFTDPWRYDPSTLHSMVQDSKWKI